MCSFVLRSSCDRISSRQEDMDTIWKVTAAILDMNSEGPAVRFSKARLKRHGGVMRLINIEKEEDRASSMSRPTVIIITGEGVSSKEITDRDPSVAKIMKSGELHVTVHTKGADCPVVEFIRKDSVSELVSELEHDCALIIEILVTKSEECIESLIEEACDQRLAMKKLPSDPHLLSALCGQLYRGLRLPLLIAYLVILSANWVFFSNINEKLQQRRTEHEAMIRSRKAAEESDSRQKGLERKFSGLPDLSACSAAGSVAASVPAGIRLTGLSISSEKDAGSSQGGSAVISISGETLNPEEIVEMSRRLADETESRQADISSIETDGRHKGMLKFKIEASR